MSKQIINTSNAPARAPVAVAKARSMSPASLRAPPTTAALTTIDTIEQDGLMANAERIGGLIRQWMVLDRGTLQS